MRIIIVTNAFFPENSPRSFRATELAKEFSRQGHMVTVLTHLHSGQQELVEKFGIKIKELGNLRYKPIAIKGSGLALLVRRIVARFLGLLIEYPDIQLVPLVNKVLKKESGYDMLISLAVPFPVHWGVARCYKKGGKLAKVWVADCGDPFMGNRSDSFRKPFYFKYVEKWFSRKTDFITIPIEAARNAYYKEFHDKIRVIPQGIDFEEYTPEKEEFMKNEVPVFCYAGSFIKDHRDPRNFIDYLLEQKTEFAFHIFTNNISLIEDQVARSGGRIIVHEYIPRKELIGKMSKMDFLINIENSTSVQAPSKLIDYYLAGRPVLSISTKEIDKSKVNQFFEGNYSDALPFKDYERFKIQNVAKAFIDLVPATQAKP